MLATNSMGAILLRAAIEKDEGRRITPRSHYVEPPVPIEIAAGHSIDCALSIAERMRFEVPAGSVVVINYAWCIDVADDEIRVAVSIEIRGYHRVRHSIRTFSFPPSSSASGFWN